MIATTNAMRVNYYKGSLQNKLERKTNDYSLLIYCAWVEVRFVESVNFLKGDLAYEFENYVKSFEDMMKGFTTVFSTANNSKEFEVDALEIIAKVLDFLGKFHSWNMVSIFLKKELYLKRASGG